MIYNALGVDYIRRGEDVPRRIMSLGSVYISVLFSSSLWQALTEGS